MNYPTEMSMEYGGTGTLLVKVEEGNRHRRCKTFSGTRWRTVRPQQLAARQQRINLIFLRKSCPQAGTPSDFSATCDGYKKMSGDIAVTVQRANISASLITPPTAQENLAYTGQEQALITAGMTDYGTMQYSLTEERHIQPGHPYRHRCRSIYRVVSGDWRCKPQRYRTRQRGGPHWAEAADDHRGNGCVQAFMMARQTRTLPA